MAEKNTELITKGFRMTQSPDIFLEEAVGLEDQLFQLAGRDCQECDFLRSSVELLAGKLYDAGFTDEDDACEIIKFLAPDYYHREDNDNEKYESNFLTELSKDYDTNAHKLSIFTDPEAKRLANNIGASTECRGQYFGRCALDMSR